MPPTYFKFTTSEGVNRRLTFSEPPTWPLLASKLHGLYGISIDDVGVSYVDNDNDVITVSSNEELQDFYKESHQGGQVIKFAVVDLHSSQDTVVRPLEFPSLNRNPFDGEAFEFVGEWERFPPLHVMEEDRSKSGPHAFVEVLSSNNSVAHDDPHEMDTDTEDDRSTVQLPSLDKGKNRALSFGAASITSVLEEEMSHKHPIHVYDLNSRKDDKAKDNNFENPSIHIHVAAQSTPKVQVKNINDNKDTEEAKTVEVEDPPLPSIDDSPTSASLFNDLASLVHDATQVVSSHPELSEGLRNIGRNINNGTYWATHRETLSNTVNGLSSPPSTEERRQAEEAVRRLTDVVGNFFRTLSQAPVDTEDSQVPNVNENLPNQSRGENLAQGSSWHPMNNTFGWAMRSHGPFGPRRGSYHHGHLPPHVPHVPGSRHHVPPMPPHFPLGSLPNGRARPFPFHHGRHPVPPPPPPPPPHAPPGAPPYHYPSPPTHDHPSPTPPPRGPARSPAVQEHVSPPSASLPLPNGSLGPMPGAQAGMRYSEMQSHGHGRRQSFQGPFGPVSGTQPSRLTAQDLRAQVEAAKRIYKAEKERYRHEREQRKREKLAHKSNVEHGVTSTPVAHTEILGERKILPNQFQDVYPEAERVNVPRRSNTHVGHGPFRHFDKKPEDLTTRVMNRIAKKLSDMGFSETVYPTLPEKIKAQMPSNGVISKEAEDDVVTTLLEELLASASGPNVASGSGQRDVEMGEAWH